MERSCAMRKCRSESQPLTLMQDTESLRTKDVALSASLFRDAVQGAEVGSPMEGIVHTPYGPAVVHVDKCGADVELPSGATVHFRRPSEN
jgi:hypothetical protein